MDDELWRGCDEARSVAGLGALWRQATLPKANILPDQDARFSAAFDEHHDRLFRGIDRCRTIIAECRSKLAARPDHAAGIAVEPQADTTKPPPGSQG